jgi:hypothetical protein
VPLLWRSEQDWFVASHSASAKSANHASSLDVIISSRTYTVVDGCAAARSAGRARWERVLHRYSTRPEPGTRFDR